MDNYQYEPAGSGKKITRFLGTLLLCLAVGFFGFQFGKKEGVKEAQIEIVTQPESSSTDTQGEEQEPQMTAVPNAIPTAVATIAPVIPVEASNPSVNFDTELFDEVWEHIQVDFDGDVPTGDDLSFQVIEGAIEALGDEFTRFVRPEAAARFREDLGGTFEGIGAFVRMNDDGKLEITRPMEGQPADLAGLKAGDLVIAVDGESVLNETIDDAVAKVRGPRGTEVVLTVEREGVEGTLEIVITRARIEIPIVESEMLEGNIAYVRLSSFSANAEEQLLEAMIPLLAENPVGFIFDLRDNPGGYLSQAVAVSDIFLSESLVLIERNRQGYYNEHNARDGGIAEAIPLVVLINKGSASASEIVAGAIQDHKRGVLIGETSFGKGSVQLPHELSNGGEIRVTIARWYTPADRTIDGQGIDPDIAVETPEEFGGENDTQLQRAIDYLLTGE